MCPAANWVEKICRILGALSYEWTTSTLLTITLFERISSAQVDIRIISILLMNGNKGDRGSGEKNATLSTNPVNEEILARILPPVGPRGTLPYYKRNDTRLDSVLYFHDTRWVFVFSGKEFP